ncbi:MAG: CRISPR-associated protein [Bacillota bacterium]|nr:MAG: CRISPR-associated protein [Bacillota bacterium]
MVSVTALKITTTARTASFRYPHVMVGRLPTYEMPPPATIYGHLCSVVGKWFDPTGLEFAYIFTHQGIGEDLETAHVVEEAGNRRGINELGLPKNLEGSINIQRRQFLLNVEMHLYVKGPSEMLNQLKIGFISPVFSYILGRSQDLATCHSAIMVDLAAGQRFFFSGTLLPWELRPYVTNGVPVLMPAKIDYLNYREPTFAQYVQIGTRPLRIDLCEEGDDVLSSRPFEQALVDANHHLEVRGVTYSRGLWFMPMRGVGN